jgi:hypothetical protein
MTSRSMVAAPDAVNQDVYWTRAITDRSPFSTSHNRGRAKQHQSRDISLVARSKSTRSLGLPPKAIDAVDLDPAKFCWKQQMIIGRRLCTNPDGSRWRRSINVGGLGTVMRGERFR